MLFAPLRQHLLQGPINPRRYPLLFGKGRRIGHVAQAADQFQGQLFPALIEVKMGIHIADVHLHADAQGLSVFFGLVGEVFLVALEEMKAHGDDDGL